MLARSHRFRGYKSIQAVHRRGRPVRAGMAAIKVLPNSHESTYRVAVIVSRKVHKSAVLRNRVRRRIYETIRCGRQPAGSYDIVISVFSDAVVELPPAELEHLIAALFRRGG